MNNKENTSDIRICVIFKEVCMVFQMNNIVEILFKNGRLKKIPFESKEETIGFLQYAVM